MDHLVSLGLLTLEDDTALCAALQYYVSAGCDELVEAVLALVPDPDIPDSREKAVTKDRLSTFVSCVELLSVGV